VARVKKPEDRDRDRVPWAFDIPRLVIVAMMVYGASELNGAFIGGAIVSLLLGR
jgi:hypothetical protein